MLAVVMPAWNEAEGIEAFLTELHEALRSFDPAFFVVDDCSSDATSSAALAARQAGITVTVVRNDENRGHGPSTVRALHLGCDSGAEYVIAVDGDGQFSGADMAGLVTLLQQTEADMAEGLRQERGNPLYRRVASLGTRALVASKAHAWPTDANTPLRAYRRAALVDMLLAVPDDTMTPNLVISAIARRWRLRIAEMPVVVRDRLGESAVGTTWGKRAATLPTKRFVAFCWNGARGWLSTPVPPAPPGR